jgi:hypothetical protein
VKAGVRLVLLQLQIELVDSSLLLAHGGSPVRCRMRVAGRHIKIVKKKRLYKISKMVKASSIERKIAKTCGGEVRDKGRGTT